MHFKVAVREIWQIIFVISARVKTKKVKVSLMSRVRFRFTGSASLGGVLLVPVVVEVVSVLVEAVLEVVLLPPVVQIRPDEPSNIPSLSAVEVSHAPQSVCAKDDAPENISFMLATLDTSHLDMSPLNDDAE